MADIICQMAVITSSLTKITFVVAEITFKLAVISSLVVKITFVVAEITFRFSCNHFLSGQDHFSSGLDIF